MGILDASVLVVASESDEYVRSPFSCTRFDKKRFVDDFEKSPVSGVDDLSAEVLSTVQPTLVDFLISNLLRKDNFSLTAPEDGPVSLDSIVLLSVYAFCDPVTCDISEMNCFVSLSS